VQDLIAAGGGQHIEIHTRQWSASVLREVAEGIAGRPWSAYLQIVWHGTDLARRAAQIGMNVGLVTLLWEDIISGDARYATLSTAEKDEIVTWAMVIAEALRKEDLRCLEAVLKAIDPVFARERENIVRVLLPCDRLQSHDLCSPIETG